MTVWHRAVDFGSISVLEVLLQQDPARSEALRIADNTSRTLLSLYQENRKMADIILRSCSDGLEYLGSGVPVLEPAAAMGSAVLDCILAYRL